MAAHRYDFFIAHRGEDTAQAKDLYRHLANTHSAFLDAVTLEKGAQWPQEIPVAQNGSRITVALLVDQQKHYQTEEIIAGVALANDPVRDHRLVPVYLTGNGRPPNPPYGLAGFNPIMAEDEGGMEGVARALKRLVDAPHEHDVHGEDALPEGVLFDRSHGQDGWNPASPTPERDFKSIATIAGATPVKANVTQITPSVLSHLDAYILPIGPGVGSHRPLAPSEVQTVVHFATGSGGLMLLSTYTGDWHHRWNLNDVARDFGLRFNVDAVTSRLERAEYGDVNANYPDDRGAFVAVPASMPHDSAWSRLLDGVTKVAMAGCCTISASSDWAIPILVSDARSKRWEPEPTGVGVQIRRYAAASAAKPYVLMAASLKHRVIAVGSWKLFTNAFIDHQGFDNKRLFENILTWLTER